MSDNSVYQILAYAFNEYMENINKPQTPSNESATTYDTNYPLDNCCDEIVVQPQSFSC